MVAKSEASMPMSRALAKLAVATDLGTAARPSTSAPMYGSAAAATAGHAVGGSGGRNGPATGGSPAMSILVKPGAARAAMAAMPLAATDNALAAPLPAPTHAPTTPRLPPLSPTGGTTGGGLGGANGSGVTNGPAGHSHSHSHTHSHSHQLPSAVPTDKSGRRAVAQAQQPRSSPAGNTQQNGHPQQQANRSPARQPLPMLSHHAATAAHPNGAAASADFGRELLDAAKKHPGLPASLLAQLHRTRSRGAAAAAAPASAPPGPVATHGTVFASSADGCGFRPFKADKAPATATATAVIRPLSPKARARATAHLTAATAAAAASGPTATGPAGPLHPSSSPPPAAIASLSPEALAVLLGPAPAGPPPATAGGLLVMRRSASVVNGAGAPLRPSTSAGMAAGPASASDVPVVPRKPHVVPHITVPYKPGSIRLPPGGVPGVTAAAVLDALGSRSGTAGSASAGGALPAASSAPLVGGDPWRPWTSAGGLPPGAQRPVTANPLTHRMDTDPSAGLVVRIPRSTTAATGTAVPAPPTASRHGAPPKLSLSFSAPASAAGGANGTAGPTAGPGVREGAVGGGLVGAAPSRKLTDEELRAVVAAVAAARPEAAALLRQRSATAETTARPGTASNGVAGGRRPPTTGGATDGAARRPWSSGPAPYSARARPSSRCGSRGGTGGSRGGLSSRGGTAAYDDVWPAPQSPRTPGGISGQDAAARGGSAGGSTGAGSGDGSITAAARASASGRPAAISAWGSQRQRPLPPIPEDMELMGEDAGDGEDDGVGLGAVGAVLAPLEPLDPDPELDTAWASIVAANRRPDTAAYKTATGSIDVFSRPVTGAPRAARQAAPMVLVLEDITSSTPEVLEHELAAMSLQELQALKSQLGS